MNSDYKIITCPYCGYEFPFKGKSNRVRCRNNECKRWFKQKYKRQQKLHTATKVADNLKDDIMQGNILDALHKADINPTNHKEMFKDAIPLILKDDKLKFAFAKACQDRKRSPETIVRKAILFWLKEKGYYET